MKKCVALSVGLLLLGGTAANTDSQTLDLTGVLTKVTAPAVLPAPYTQQPWAVGQAISGMCTIDLDGVTPVDMGGGTFNYSTASNYLLTISGVEIGPLLFHHATNLFITDGALGKPDILHIHDDIPAETIDPPNHIGYFDDLDIVLSDPTGTAFRGPGKSVDLSKFVEGDISAEGNGTPFSGVELDGTLAAKPVSVPEPGTMPLFLTATVVLAWVCRRPRSRQRLR
jgi:hypothetical protein